MSVASIEKKARLWQRDPLDWYVEPERATTALLAKESFDGLVWDPACGGGNIVRVLRAAGYRAFGSDIEDRQTLRRQDPDAWIGVFDFLAEDLPITSYPNIVMNPPFFGAKGAERFLRRALGVATCKVAMFCDIRFLAGGERAESLFNTYAPTRVWIVTPRVSCPPGTYLAAGNKAGNGSSDWCWFVWDLQADPAPTQLGWLKRSDAA